MAIFRVGLQIGGLNLLADKLGVFGDQIAFQVLQILLCLILRKLLALNLLLQHIEKVHRVRRHFVVIEVKHARQDFKREAGREAVHALVNAGVVVILLPGFRFRVGILQAFAVIDAHFRIDAGVFRLFQARQDRESGQGFQRAGRAGRGSQFAVVKQFLVDFDLFGNAQAVRHLDDVDAVKKRLIVFVVAEGHPFRFVGVRQDNAVKRQRGDPLRTVVVPFLRRGQQGVQHLNRRLEHLNEFHDPLVSAAQRAGITVGVGIVLRVILQLADIDFTH